MTEPVGSLGEEATRLFAAAEDWLNGARSRTGAAREDDTTGRAVHSGADCAICPFCQLLSVLRGSRPELVEHLAAAATSLVQAARVVMDGLERGDEGKAPPPTVQRIDIS